MPGFPDGLADGDVTLALCEIKFSKFLLLLLMIKIVLANLGDIRCCFHFYFITKSIIQLFNHYYHI